MTHRPPLYRRPRCNPRADEVHFLRVGFVVAACLMLALPALFGAMEAAPQPKIDEASR